jgi:outer membrane receptor protein involved in Fe transport
MGLPPPFWPVRFEFFPHPCRFFGVRRIAQDSSAMTITSLRYCDENGLAEITVTAQKRSQNLQDVPIAITAFSEDALRGKGITNQNLLDVDHAEILKRPQGTLFGRDTIGGAISIVTRTPGDEFALQGQATAGSFNRRDVSLTADIPLAPTVLSTIT